MSSIVKARQLINLPRRENIEYLKEAPEPVPSIQTETRGQDTGEWIEKKESIIRQALKKAEHIENEAKLRADSIVENSMKSSREIMSVAEKKGYEEGYLRGLVDGASASEKAAEESLLELRRLGECFRTEHKERLKQEEKELFDIALELSGKIMKQHVQADEGALLKMLEEIMQENEGSMKIYLSEYQKSLDIRIDKATAKKIKSMFKGAKLVLLKEEDLIMGENESGIVDMSVPAQLEQLKKVVSHATS